MTPLPKYIDRLLQQLQNAADMHERARLIADISSRFEIELRLSKLEAFSRGRDSVKNFVTSQHSL